MREYEFGSGCTNPATFPGRGAGRGRGGGDTGGRRGLRPLPGGPRSRRAAGSDGPKGIRPRGNRGLPADSIALTNGSMQAVTLVAEALMKGKEDIAVTEELTYSGTIALYRRLGIEMVGVPLDGQGMRVDALEETLRRLHDQGTPPRFIYTLATYQNPTGSVMPRARRLELLEVAQRFDCVVVEDKLLRRRPLRGGEGAGPVRPRRRAQPGLHLLAVEDLRPRRPPRLLHREAPAARPHSRPPLRRGQQPAGRRGRSRVLPRPAVGALRAH